MTPRPWHGRTRPCSGRTVIYSQEGVAQWSRPVAHWSRLIIRGILACIPLMLPSLGALLKCYTQAVHGLLILEPGLMPKMQFKRPVRECKPDSQNQLIEPESRLGVTGSTFFYATPKLWNNVISPSHANAPSVDTFKRIILATKCKQDSGMCPTLMSYS